MCSYVYHELLRIWPGCSEHGASNSRWRTMAGVNCTKRGKRTIRLDGCIAPMTTGAGFGEGTPSGKQQRIVGT